MEMSSDTLIKLSQAKNYNQWVYDLCQPYLGQRLLEVGCGIGNMTAQFISHGHTIMATDIAHERITAVRERWKDNPQLHSAIWDVSLEPNESIIHYQADTVICINMLEHIENDLQTLQHFYKLLPESGKLIIYVPAMPWLYGTLDKQLDHYRRYTMRSLSDVVKQSQFKIIKKKHVNGAGIFGWWFNGKLLKRTHFSERQIHVYDKLIPFIRKTDAIFSPIIGQSIMMVVSK